MSRTSPPKRGQTTPKTQPPPSEAAPPPPPPANGPPNPAGKYALLEVPEFATDAANGRAMTSFVRLGVPNRSHDEDGGADLLNTAKSVGWASDLLDQRGGLRDHSDGDRISTTRGHKVDVISGNYKRVLATESASGGSAREDHAHEGGVLTMTSTKVNVIEKTQTHGERHDTFTGPKIEKKTGIQQGAVINDKILAQVQSNTADATPDTHDGDTGSEDEEEPSGSPDGAGGPDEEPEGEEASASEDEAEEEEESGDVTTIEQETSVGNSSELNAGLIMNEQTFALAMNSTTSAGFISEQTLVGRMESTTLVGSSLETTWAGELHSATSALLMNDVTTAVVSNAVTQVAFINEATAATMILSDTKAAMLFESTLIPLQNAFNMGDSIDVRIGNQFAIAGPTAIEVWVGIFTEIFAGVALSFRLAASAEITLGAGAELYAGLSAEIFLGGKLEVTVAKVIEISAGGKYEIDNMDTLTAGTTLTNIGTKLQSIAAALHMGA